MPERRAEEVRAGEGPTDVDVDVDVRESPRNESPLELSFRPGIARRATDPPRAEQAPGRDRGSGGSARAH